MKLLILKSYVAGHYRRAKSGALIFIKPHHNNVSSNNFTNTDNESTITSKPKQEDGGTKMLSSDKREINIRLIRELIISSPREQEKRARLALNAFRSGNNIEAMHFLENAIIEDNGEWDEQAKKVIAMLSELNEKS